MKKQKQAAEDSFSDIALFSGKTLKKFWSNNSDEVWNKYLDQ